MRSETPTARPEAPPSPVGGALTAFVQERGTLVFPGAFSRSLHEAQCLWLDKVSIPKLAIGVRVRKRYFFMLITAQP